MGYNVKAPVVDLPANAIAARMRLSLQKKIYSAKSDVIKACMRDPGRAYPFAAIACSAWAIAIVSIASSGSATKRRVRAAICWNTS